MQTLFDTFRTSLDRFFERIDLDAVEKVLHVILGCQGTVLFSGVGKSGFIAQKIAATFVSTGTRALFLKPVDALHGDIGIVSKNDVFLAFSKSGESGELLQLIPHVRKKGAVAISVVSDPTSRLAKASDLIAYLPVQKELCPFDLAPTISTAAQLIFGDCLAIALMQAKQFTRDDFASNHPAGFLGLKSTLKVSDLMIRGKEMPICQEQSRLIDVLHILTGKRCGCILIVDDDFKLQGIFTDGDLRRAIETKGEEALRMPMKQLMTHSPRTVEVNQCAIIALRQMEEDAEQLITVLPVLDSGKIIGLLRMHDILQSGLR